MRDPSPTRRLDAFRSLLLFSSLLCQMVQPLSIITCLIFQMEAPCLRCQVHQLPYPLHLPSALCQTAPMEFFTPNLQLADPTPLPRPCPQRTVRDPNVISQSSLLGPFLGPARQSQSHLQPNPHLNPCYINPDNAAQMQTQPCMHGESSGGARINNVQLLTALVYAAVANFQDPLSFQEVMGSEHAGDWRDVCQYEMDAMAKNKVWVLVYLPPGSKAVTSRWVFQCKADLHYHTRVVAKGFTQILGLDYDETFSPVAQFKSLQLLLVLATLED